MKERGRAKWPSFVRLDCVDWRKRAGRKEGRGVSIFVSNALPLSSPVEPRAYIHADE